jgi:hypothetical protein
MKLRDVTLGVEGLFGVVEVLQTAHRFVDEAVTFHVPR